MAKTSCPSENMVGDVCAGVPLEPLCAGSACNGGCQGVISVSDDAKLGEAIASANAGSCISLEPGKYGSVTLPSGVSIFGHSATNTQVVSITVAGGNARIAGLTISGDGLVIETGTTSLDGVRIIDSATDGMVVKAGASVNLDRSEIRGSGRYGISAFDASSVSVNRSIVDSSSGPGMWLQCASGCDCESPISVVIKDTNVRQNAKVGISLVGVVATLENVAVLATTVGSNFDHGGGLSISGCSSVDGRNLTIAESTDFGLLIDDSKVTIDGLVVDNNMRGVWVQRIGNGMPGASVSLIDATVSGNAGVGIGVDGASQNVFVSNSSIDETAAISLPVLVSGVSAGAQEVGDGVAWLGLSQLTLDQVSVSKSSRASVLIDGSVGANSSISDLLLSGGDEKLGILQQNFTDGAVPPSIKGTTPSVFSELSSVHAIPEQIAVPPGI